MYSLRYISFVDKCVSGGVGVWMWVIVYDIFLCSQMCVSGGVGVWVWLIVYDMFLCSQMCVSGGVGVWVRTV